MSGDGVRVIAALFAGQGARGYLGEPVTAGAHMLLAGALAEAAGAPPALVAAALLHDVGHLRGPDGTAGAADGRGDARHAEAGAAWLSAWFPAAVTEPVRLHVAAKRYLCAVEPGYCGRLSEASVHTLALQGGPMTPAEAAAFAAHEYARDAVAVRRWDDLAKDPAAPLPGFGRFRPLLAGLLRG